MKKNYYLLLFVFSVFTTQAQIITTIAGTGSSGFSGDGGKATEAKLNLPFTITFDKEDNIFIADTYNNSIRKIELKSGIISTVVGTADKSKISEIKTPTGLTFDNFNNLYIADLARLRIRKVNLDKKSSITLVGQKSETEHPNIDASLAGPFNVIFDKTGNLYISTNEDSRVSKVDFSTGKVTIIAGTGIAGFSGDGRKATEAQLTNPTGLALDGKGNLYISDTGNDRIRKVDLTTGIIRTIAGTGINGFSGEGELATNANLSNPLGLVIDKAGDLYVVDRGNNRVRKINTASGMISTIVGTGKEGFSGDGELATDAKLANPTGLAFNKAGDLYIVDRGNNRIRKVSGLLINTKQEFTAEESISIYPNPAKDKLTIKLRNNTTLKSALLFDVTGKQVNVPVINNSLNVSKLPRGVYNLQLKTSNGDLQQKIVLE